MDMGLRLISWLILPITVPMWMVEGIYRRISKRFWQFDVFSGSMYALLLVGLAFGMQLSSLGVLRIISLYVLSALELIGIVACTTVILGNVGGYKTTLRRLARRKPYHGSEESLDISDLWVAVTGYLYTAFYSAVLSYFIYNLDNTSYAGVQGQSTFEVLFDFIYFSYVSMTTLGYTDVAPANILSKFVYMIQVTLGIFFMLFIFSLLANTLISRRTDDSI